MKAKVAVEFLLAVRGPLADDGEVVYTDHGN